MNFSLARGASLIVLAEAAYVAMWALTKKLGTDYPPEQILLFRMGVALLVTAVFIQLKGGVRIITTAHPGAHFLRSVLGTCSALLAIWCIPRLTLGAVGTITQLGPVVIAVLGILFLHERMTRPLLLCLITGLIGALLAAGGAELAISYAAIALLASNTLYSASIVLTRHLVKRDHPLAVVFYASVMAVTVSAFACWWRGFISPRNEDMILLLGIGLCAAGAQYMIAEAHRHADASALAPFGYSNVVLAFLAGAIFWSEYPTWAQVAGAALVIASTLYLALKPAQPETR